MHDPAVTEARQNRIKAKHDEIEKRHSKGIADLASTVHVLGMLGMLTGFDGQLMSMDSIADEIAKFVKSEVEKAREATVQASHVSADMLASIAKPMDLGVGPAA